MSKRSELVFVPTSRTTWDLPRFVHLLGTFTALTPSRGHNHTGNKGLMQVDTDFFFWWYIIISTAHQKSTAALWMRKQLNKQNPQHIFLLTAWAFILTSQLIYNRCCFIYFQKHTVTCTVCPLVCELLRKTVFSGYNLSSIGFVSSFICLFSWLTSVRSRWDPRFILLCSEKAMRTHVCRRGHVFYIKPTYCTCDLWPLNCLLLVINTHQVVPTYANTHINPPRQIGPSVPSACLDSIRHLWMAST